jgi:hypothetical protein
MPVGVVDPGDVQRATGAMVNDGKIRDPWRKLVLGNGRPSSVTKATVISRPKGRKVAPPSRETVIYMEAGLAVLAFVLTQTTYTAGREKAQKVGGGMITLASLCLAQESAMHQAGEVELARIWAKVEQIRAKQAAKPKHSPLPATPTTQECEWGPDPRIDGLQL